MKISLLFMLIFVEINFAQEISVVSVKQLTNLSQGEFYYPLGNNDDSKIAFSNENYKSLWTLNMANGQLEKINDYYSSGYEENFTNDNQLVFRKDDFRNNLRFISIYKYDISKKSETVIASELRNITQIKIVNGNEIIYSQDQNLLEIKQNDKLPKISNNSLPIVMIENSNLVLYKNGERIVLNPNGDGNYLWASVSPDGNKLAYTFAEVGSFVTNLDGKIIGNLGFAHYPQWSNDSKWIVFMKDYDNGEIVTESDLFISSLDGKKVFKITDTKEIHEMYPVWSKSKNSVYFNSFNGIIYEIELKFN